MAGYSGTPLPQKLGIKEGHVVVALGAPDEVVESLGVPVERRNAERADIVLLFTTQREELARRLEGLRAAIEPDGALWVCWPKKAAKMRTDITEDVIREVVLPTGLVDVKVCAVDDTWSALKFVRRVADR